MSSILIRRANIVSGGSGPTPPYDSKIEYLGSSGTQWINTNFAPNGSNIRVIIDVYVTANGDFLIFGISGTNPRLANNVVNRTKVYMRYRNYNTAFTITTGRHVIETGPQMIIDGSVVATPTFSGNTFVGNTNTLGLYANFNGNYKMTGRIYEFSVYDGNEPKLHYIPVRVGQVGYMYDTVSEELFGNSGTGNFVLGPDIT